MKSIRLHTVIFGEHYFNCLERGLIPSLMWEKNKATLEFAQAKWSVFVKKSDHDRAWDLVTKVLPKDQVDIFTIVPERMKHESQDRGTVLLDCLNKTAELCIAENSSMLMALPDFIFGDGSIRAFMEYGYEKNCVMVPHPRVLPGILNHITNKPLNNIDLVTLSWEHLHRSWTDSEVGPLQLGSFVGGVSWRHMPDNIIAVQHRLPSVALANFTVEDIEYFNEWHGDQGPAFGRYDWEWPSECLIEQQRQRTISSSDIAFWCEVTMPDENCPTRQSSNPKEPDAFFMDNKHSRANRMIISSFRHDGSIR